MPSREDSAPGQMSYLRADEEMYDKCAGPGKATGAADERKPWREFRIAFTREVSGVDGFMHMLKEMRKEVENAAQTHQPSPLL